MQTFRPDTQNVRVKGPNAFVNIVMLAAVYFTFRLCVDLFWHSEEVDNLPRLIVSALVWAIASACFTVAYAKIQLRKYELCVDDNMMRVRSKWMDRTVHRGEIRTLVEKKHGLIVSSRGTVGTFLWGGVLISRMLPEYEQVKSLAESWKAS